MILSAFLSGSLSILSWLVSFSFGAHAIGFFGEAAEQGIHILRPALQEPTDELPAGNLYLNSMCYAEDASSDINDWRGRILILETPN